MKVDIGGIFVDVDEQLLEIDRSECEDSLYMFLRGAWRNIDSAPWTDGWPIEAIAEHLQAVCDGQIQKLIINLPPRLGKQVADDTPVITTKDWKTHGELVVGDEVFHPSGKPTRVLAVSEKTPSDVRVEFFDGSVFYCHENHEWTLYSRGARQWETMETRRFFESDRVTSNDRAAYFLPPIEPRKGTEKRLIGLKSVTHDPVGKIGNCIQVDAPDGLYLIGKKLVPTHNSSLVSVAFPAWVWAQKEKTPTSGPGVPVLAASYAGQLALRDSVKCRRLIESPWYQQRWGDRFTLNSDQNTKGRFTNDHGGERLITSVGAAVTGEGGNIILIDDPNAANEAFSEATIQTTIDWFDSVISTRLSDAKNGAFVIIQQRLAEDDLTGHILETQSEDWTHLCLPMLYEPERSYHTSIGWKDPRTVPGELLWPDRFGTKEIDTLKKALGKYGFAGQMQQRPEPAGGGIIQRGWWQLWEDAAFPPMDYILASLDTAYTDKTFNDPSAMTIWGVFTGGVVAQSTRVIGRDGRPAYNERSYMETAPRLMLIDAWQEHLEFHGLIEKVRATAKRFKIDHIVIENKAAGHSVAQELRRILGQENFGIELIDPKSQDKMARLYSIQHIFEEGMVYAPDKAWAEMTITQVAQFPKGKRDDIVDTLSMAVKKLRDMGLLTRGEERTAEINNMVVYPGDNKTSPLYPA